MRDLYEMQKRQDEHRRRLFKNPDTVIHWTSSAVPDPCTEDEVRSSKMTCAETANHLGCSLRHLADAMQVLHDADLVGFAYLLDDSQVTVFWRGQ